MHVSKMLISTRGGVMPCRSARRIAGAWDWYLGKPAIRSETSHRTAWLQTFLMVVLLGSRSVAAAADWLDPQVTDAVWAQPLDAVSASPLPPIESVSHDSVTVEQPSMPCDLFVGYDRGFVIATHGEAGDFRGDDPFLLRVNSWLQLRHTRFESDGPNPDQNSFSFERLRLALSGNVFSKDFEYFLQLDGNSDRSTQAIFLDYYVTYDLGRSLFGWDANNLGMKAGKWKVPFSRSRAESGRALQFTDRATANVLFDLNRAIGVGLYGQIDPFATPLHFETAVFNGFRTGSQSTSRSDAEIDGNFGWSLRTYADLFGASGLDGEPDLSWHEVPALRVGGGAASTRVNAEGTAEFSRQRVVDSGATLASLLPARVDEYDVWLYTVDTHFKYRGFSIIAEYYWRDMSQFRGGSVPGLRDHGFVLQTGYFVCPKKLEVLCRWSRIVGNSGTLGLLEESSDEMAGGFVWYIRGQNVKLTLDVTQVNGVPVSSDRLDLLPGDAGWLLRTQLQVAF